MPVVGIAAPNYLQGERAQERERERERERASERERERERDRQTDSETERERRGRVVAWREGRGDTDNKPLSHEGAPGT